CTSPRRPVAFSRFNVSPAAAAGEWGCSATAGHGRRRSGAQGGNSDMLSDKVPGKGTHIPPQVKPPRSPRPWKSICAVVGAIIALIPATNAEFQQLTGVPPGPALLLALVGGGFLGAAVGRAIERRRDRRIFLERHPELREREA